MYITFNKGETITHEGDDAASFYIIKEGMVSVMHGGKELRRMGKGEYFGEQSFLSEKGVRSTTVQALEKVACLTLGRTQLIAILGDEIEKIIFKNTQRNAIVASPLLKGLTSIQIEKVVDHMNIVKHPNDTVVFHKGSPCDKLVVVLEGTLKKVLRC